MRAHVVGLNAIMLSCMACADLTALDQMSSEHKLLGGELTNAHPEIGRFDLMVQGQGGLCTTTLIRANVALTAAHCVNYLSDVANFGSIVLNGSRFSVLAALSFSEGVGAEDIALLELANSVPSTVAKPAQVHEGEPESGSQAEIYGFGCNDRERRDGTLSGRKQTVQFTVGEGSSNLCPGDSGGPVFVNGSVAWVNSAYYVGSGKDVYAAVGRYYRDVNDYADRISTEGVAKILNAMNQVTQQAEETPEENDHANESAGDFCEKQGYYNDGVCHVFCDQPDPDCRSGETESSETGSSAQVNPSPEDDDICSIYGYYNDGVCDVFCDQLDPDCES